VKAMSPVRDELASRMGKDLVASIVKAANTK
jgi:hypothetical protein